MCVCVRARAGGAWIGPRMCVPAPVCVSEVGCGRTSAGVCFSTCRLTYPVCHVQAPSCLRRVWFHHIFRHYLINDMIFGKKSLNIKCIFSLQYLFETYLIIKRIQRDFVINVKTSSCKAPVIFKDFNGT